MAMNTRPTTPTSANIANGMITPCSMIDPSRLGEEAEAGRSVDRSSCDLGKRPGALRAVRDRLERDPTRGAARLPALDAAKLIEGVDERIAASASLFHEMESSSRQRSIVHASRAARKYPVCGCRTDGLVCWDRKMCRTGGKTYTVRRRNAARHALGLIVARRRGPPHSQEPASSRAETNARLPRRRRRCAGASRALQEGGTPRTDPAPIRDPLPWPSRTLPSESSR